MSNLVIPTNGNVVGEDDHFIDEDNFIFDDFIFVDKYIDDIVILDHFDNDNKLHVVDIIEVPQNLDLNEKNLKKKVAQIAVDSAKLIVSTTQIVTNISKVAITTVDSAVDASQTLINHSNNLINGLQHKVDSL